MTQAPDAVDGDQVRGPGTRHLHRLVGRDASTRERRCVQRIEAFGDSSHKGRLGQCVLGIGSVDRVSRVRLVGHRVSRPDAQYSQAPQAYPSQGMATLSPSVGLSTPAPNISTMPTPSCPGMKGGLGLTGQSPCAVRIFGVAQSTRLHLHQHLTVVRLGRRHLLDQQRLVERMNDGSFHGVHLVECPRCFASVSSGAKTREVMTKCRSSPAGREKPSGAPMPTPRMSWVCFQASN
jgi:hypothetical protein